MTKRFKDAVKKYVADGNLTKEEKEDLMKIAFEDVINETDAIIYINGELKKIINRRQIRKEIVNTTKEIGVIVVSVGSFVLTTLVAFGKINQQKKSKV